MMSSLLSEDVTVENWSTINDSISFKSNNSLPVTCDNYTLPWTRYAFASLLVSFQHSDPPTYWYKMSNDYYGSLCELLRVKECMFYSVLKICGLIRYQLYRRNIIMYTLKDKIELICNWICVDRYINKIISFDCSRKKLYLVRIGRKLPTSNLKASLQFGKK